MLYHIIIITIAGITHVESRVDNQYKNGVEEVKSDEYPYIVALLEIYTDYNYKTDVFSFCTGSMINKQWALTAAHCIDKRADKELYIWYHNFSLSPLKSKLFSKILNVEMHPEYRERNSSLINDISLLFVRRVYLMGYGILSNIDNAAMTGLSVTSVSGDRTNQPGDHTMRLMRSNDGKVNKCDEDLVTSKDMLCVAPKFNSSWNHNCFGDAGGPALYDGEIVGVCSFAYVKNVTIGVFTPVKPFLAWINEVIHTKNSENIIYGTH